GRVLDARTIPHDQDVPGLPCLPGDGDATRGARQLESPVPTHLQEERGAQRAHEVHAVRRVRDPHEREAALRQTRLQRLPVTHELRREDTPGTRRVTARRHDQQYSRKKVPHGGKSSYVHMSATNLLSRASGGKRDGVRRADTRKIAVHRRLRECWSRATLRAALIVLPTTRTPGYIAAPTTGQSFRV